MANAPTKRATVVVGVKGTGESRAAIRLAAQEARYRDAALVATMAFRTDSAMGAPAGRPPSVARTAVDWRTAAASALRDEVVDALGDEAEEVELRTVPGLAGRTLVDTARKVNAELIVLAGRGAAATVPGTVSQYVLRRAPCPVLVVPSADGVRVGRLPNWFQVVSRACSAASSVSGRPCSRRKSGIVSDAMVEVSDASGCES